MPHEISGFHFILLDPRVLAASPSRTGVVSNKLDQWIQEVIDGKNPDFGADLLY
jgi:hypothetical protein